MLPFFYGYITTDMKPKLYFRQHINHAWRICFSPSHRKNTYIIYKTHQNATELAMDVQFYV